MDGSISGNIAGAGYFLLYQVIGCALVFCILRKEELLEKILFGSVFGSVLCMWMTALFSLGFNFTRKSHIVAMIVTTGLAVVFLFFFRAGSFVRMLRPEKEDGKRKKHSVQELIKSNGYLLMIVPVFVFFVILLCTHTIPYGADGSIHTGQATNGDMNMHLSFITSIANQGTFPPDYSMLPGTKLCYPFLCDTISASIFLLGASLRFAYIFPMLFAVAQVFLGVMLLAAAVCKSRVKAAVAWIFFFFNGGFGVVWFLQGAFSDSSVFTRMFTEFYQTPTNYAEKNIRFVNVIVDMLLPQRATLFGFACLFPLILLLYRAITQNKRGYFVFAAVLAGSLPMIHTHSFLALALLCLMWAVYSLRTQADGSWRTREPRAERILVFLFFLILCGLDVLQKVVDLSSAVFFSIAAAGILAAVFAGIFFAVKAWHTESGKKLVISWACFLGIVLFLSLPQLFTWTFLQVQSGQFVRGYFNWANSGDTYLGFYLKNLGIVGILGVIALIFTRIRNYFFVAPFLLIWFTAELVVFQPNVYDNNKLLVVAYLFLCLIAADYLVSLCEKIGKRALQAVIYAVTLCVSTVSAVLTMGREALSDYTLYSADEVAMCKYIEKNTQAFAVILTDTRYNNGVVSLTGRNIVCGSGTFLYYHGLSYQDREKDVEAMYEDPTDMTLFDRYQVEYVLVGDSERASYAVADDEAFLENFTVVHEENSMVLYQRLDAVTDFTNE